MKKKKEHPSVFIIVFLQINLKKVCLFIVKIFNPNQMRKVSTTIILLTVLGLLAHTIEGSGFRRSLQDPHCHSWNYDTNSCDQCSFRYYLNAGICTQVSDHCKEWSETNGHCTDCYQGYYLNEADGTCNIGDGGTTTTPGNGDIPEGCKLYDCQTQECIECKEGYELHEDGTCQIPQTGGVDPDPNCKIWDCVTEKCV